MASAQYSASNCPSNGHAYSRSMGDVAEYRSTRRIIDVDQIATSPSAPYEISTLIEQFNSCGKLLSLDDTQARWKLRDVARALADALETPRERLIRQCWSQPTEYAAIEIAVDLGVFRVLAEVVDPMSAAELARATHSDPVMLSRILKHLAATGVITETGPDTYCGTNFSHTLSVEKYSDGYPVVANWFHPAIFAFPEFFKQTNYRNPTDPTQSAFQLGHKTTNHFFQFAQQDPVLAKHFSNHMAVYRQGRPSWMDEGFYPVKERLMDGANIADQDVLLVDMGGNTGHDLSEFRQKWPDAPGRLILQDLPSVLEGAEQLHPSIEPMAHDFFTKQPIQGARAYYMHSVLHDWPDYVCQKILANLLPALRPGYSRLLINENVVAPTGAHYETTSLDCIMMSIGSTERTEAHWVRLIESVGLRIVKIWTVHSGIESLIECEVA